MLAHCESFVCYGLYLNFYFNFMIILHNLLVMWPLFNDLSHITITITIKQKRLASLPHNVYYT